MIIVHQGKSYVARNGDHYSNARLSAHPTFEGMWTLDDVNGRPHGFNGDGSPWGYMPTSFDPFALVAEADPSASVTDTHAIETVEGPQIADTPEWAKGVEAEASVEYAVGERGYSSGAAEEPLRVKLLHEGAQLTNGARDIEYGKPSVNMAAAGALKAAFRAHLARAIDPAELEAIDLALTKIGRMATGKKPKRDTYVDGATYLAIAGEIALEADSKSA